jgi:hypothetical protein
MAHSLFDIYVKQTDGTAVAYTVKLEARVKGDFLRDIAWIAAQARASGFVSEVRLLSDTDLNQIELHNARLMHGMRASDLEADSAAATVFNAMSGISRLMDLSSRIGLGAYGFRALIRLIRSHQLHLVHHEKITHASEVYKGKLI